MVEEALDFAEGDDEVADAQLLRFDALMQQGDPRRARLIARQGLPAGPFESGHVWIS